MFLTGKMKFIELTVQRKNLDETMELLGENRCLELTKNENDIPAAIDITAFDKINFIEEGFHKIFDFFNVNPPSEIGTLRGLPEIYDYVDKILARILPIKEKLDELNRKEKEVRNRLGEVGRFVSSGMSKSEKESFSFLYCVMGEGEPEKVATLSEKFQGIIYIRDCGNRLFLLMVPKKKRWELEAELEKIKFKVVEFPDTEGVLPEDYADRLKVQISEIQREKIEFENQQREFASIEMKKLLDYYQSFNLKRMFDEVTVNLPGTQDLVYIKGWMQKNKLNKITQELRKRYGERFRLQVYEPEELEGVKSGKMEIPVAMNNPKILKPFESIIYNYGTPGYGTINPTFFVTVTFLMFYGMMFGDMGQGAVIAVGGICMALLPKRKNQFGFVVFAVGIMAILFGYLYGSAFCFERETLSPILTPINQALFHINRPYIVNITPENSTNIFVFTILVGVCVNMMGMVINVINGFLKKKPLRALLSTTGGTGLLITGGTLLLVLELFLFQKPVSFATKTMIFSAIPLVILREPLIRVAGKEKPVFVDGIGMWLVLSFVELFEAALNLISNNLSFIRIGAFAFAHGILSSVAIRITNMAGGVFSFGGMAVLIFFNLLIIGLEGLIVGIQALRLEYYEFFSKFFSEQGRKFFPFKIYR